MACLEFPSAQHCFASSSLRINWCIVLNFYEGQGVEDMHLREGDRITVLCWTDLHILCFHSALCALTHTVMLGSLHLSTCLAGWLPSMYPRMLNVLCLSLSQFIEVITAVVFGLCLERVKSLRIKRHVRWYVLEGLVKSEGEWALLWSSAIVSRT